MQRLVNRHSRHIRPLAFSREARRHHAPHQYACIVYKSAKTLMCMHVCIYIVHTYL